MTGKSEYFHEFWMMGKTEKCGFSRAINARKDEKKGVFSRAVNEMRIEMHKCEKI